MPACAVAINHENRHSTVKNRRILITRPADRQQELREAITALGGEALSLPLLAIKPMEQSVRLRQGLAQLADYDLLIFVSANAARFGVAGIQAAGASLSPAVTILAVGAATAREVSLLLDRPVYSPAGGSGSEALLELPELAAVEGRKVAIFRGEGGRELLAAELRHRGAVVTYLEVYRRVPAPDAGTGLRQILAGGALDGVILTSAEALRHWHVLIFAAKPDGCPMAASELTIVAGSDGCPIAAPFALPLIVPSRRVAELAAQLGFRVVINAGDAGATAMVEVLAAHFRRQGV